jgi:pimeloyl-ACP methyl ester carboxylesterase
VRRRVTSALAAAGLVLALAACSSTDSGSSGPAPSGSSPVTSASPSADTSSAPADPLASYYGQQLSWSGCGGAFECTKLRVPVDYDDPAGASLELAVIRLRAGNADNRIGSLVINPGGPGGSGVDYARAARAIFDAPIRQRYDIVGFDPRGVGSSDPVECLTDSQVDDLLSDDGTPDDAAEVTTLETLSHGVATGCATRAAGLYAHIGTVDVARDVDVLRSALGDERLNWFGASYGTFIGATYADEFPTRVGRMVLDGAIDPTLTNSQLAQGQANGVEVALRRVEDACDTRANCPLPDGVDAGMARIRQFFASLDATPLSTGGGRPLTQALAMNAVLYYLYFPPTDWQQLRYGLADAFAGDGATLLDMLDQRTERGPGGHYRDNSTSALIAVNALDLTDRPGAQEIAKLATAWSKQSPTWGAFLAWSNLPFHYWQAPATLTPHAVNAPGAPPILVVGTTYDPATPYAWAQALADQLDSGVLLTRVGDGHTGYGMGSECTDRAIDSYLTTGTPPKAGLVCH